MSKDFWEDNPEFTRMVNDLFSGTRLGGTGIEFKLKPDQNGYIYWEVGQTMFCYTPHKCTKGWYYAFQYVPNGPGARTGKAKRWKLQGLVKFRKRKLAKARAYERLEKASNERAAKIRAEKEKQPDNEERAVIEE